MSRGGPCIEACLRTQARLRVCCVARRSSHNSSTCQAARVLHAQHVVCVRQRQTRTSPSGLYPVAISRGFSVRFPPQSCPAIGIASSVTGSPDVPMLKIDKIRLLARLLRGSGPQAGSAAAGAAVAVRAVVLGLAVQPGAVAGILARSKETSSVSNIVGG